MGALNARVRWRPAGPEAGMRHTSRWRDWLRSGRPKRLREKSATVPSPSCAIEPRSLRVAHDREASSPGPPRLGR
jgi:hypothetical protein